jgi:hypothetical protein
VEADESAQRAKEAGMDSDNEKIRARAYELWDRDGRQHGRDEEHWLEAERELGAARARGAGAPNPPAATAGETPVQASVNAKGNAKSNGTAKPPAAKTAPRKRRGAQPQSQA